MENKSENAQHSATMRNRSVFTALFAALICTSSFFVVPLPGGIPIVLKNLMVVLSATILGSYHGTAAVALFLAAGILGLPVLSGGGGFATFVSPSGGYLFGYLAGTCAAGFILGRPSITEKKVTAKNCVKIAVASFAAFAIIDLVGAIHLMRVNSLSFAGALMAGVVPYIPVDLLKFALSIPLTLKLRPIAARYIAGE